MAVPAMLRVVITKIKGRLFMRALLCHFARVERPPKTNSGMGTLFDQLIGAQQPVWFIDLAVLRLIDSLNELGAA